MKYDEKDHDTLWALSFFFSSLSFYHGLDMFLATRDALVINGSYLGFFTSSSVVKIPSSMRYIDVSSMFISFQFKIKTPKNWNLPKGK